MNCTPIPALLRSPHYIFLAILFILMPLGTAVLADIDSRASESRLSIRILSKRAAGTIRNRRGFQFSSSYHRLTEGSPERESTSGRQRDRESTPRITGLQREGSLGQRLGSLGTTRASPVPSSSRASSSRASSSLASTPPPRPIQWETPTKVAVASVEAKRTTGATFRAFTKTPDEKADHIGSRFGKEPYVVSHPVKASAGGQSPAGGQLEATAQGRWTHVRLHLKEEGAQGYVRAFYDGKPLETHMYTHEDGKVKLNLPPDSGGRRMGVVAGVVGKGSVKVKGTNNAKARQV